MAVQRLNHSDAAWTRHSLHAHQHQYDMMRYGCYDGINCPWDPCRTQPIQYERSLYTPPKQDNFASKLPFGEKTRIEKAQEKQRVKEIRDDAYGAVLQTRSSRGINDLNDAPSFERMSTPSHKDTASMVAKDATKTTKREIKDAERIGKTAYYEGRELYGMFEHEIKNAGLSSNDTVNRAVDSTIHEVISPHKSLVGSSVLTAAALVSTVATVNLAALKSDLYVAECKNLGKSLGVEFQKERVTTAITSATSFGTYMHAVQDSKAYERLARQDAEKVRDQQIVAADNKVKAAETRYENQVAIFTTTRDREADKFARNMRDLDAQQDKIQNNPGIQKINERRQEKLDNAIATYENKRASIEADKQRALDKIDKSIPIAAAQMRVAAEPFEKRLATLEHNHKRDVANINSQHDQQIEHKMAGAAQKLAEIAAARETLQQKHNAAQADFANKIKGAQKERDTSIGAAKEEATQAQKKFAETKLTIKQEGKDRVADVKQIATGDYQAARAAKQNLGIARTAVFVGGGAQNAQQLKSILVSNQAQLSEFMVQNFGTAEEKQIINAFFSDQKKMQQIGAPSSLSGKDRANAEKILAKYGFSDMTSIKSVDDSIKILKQNLPALKLMAKQDKDALDAAKLEIKNLTTERKTLLNLAGGVENLSAKQKKQLAEIDAKLATAKKTKKDLKDKADKSGKAASLAESQIKNMGRFKSILPHMGKNKKQSTKAVIKQYSVTAKRVSASLGGALIAMSRIIPAGTNTIAQADARFKQQVGEVMKYTNFATNSIQRTAQIGLTATKMVLGVGKFGGRTLKVIAGRSWLHTRVKEKLLKLAEKHMGAARAIFLANKGFKFVGGKVGGLGKAGFKLGGKLTKTALRAPGAVLKLASTSITDLPDMATRAAASVVVHTGVAVVGAASRGVIKAGVKVGRVPVKYAAKGVGAVGKIAGKQAVRVGKAAGRGAMKVGVRVGRSVGRGAATVFRKTIGRTALWDKAQKLGKSVAKGAKAVGQVAEKIAKKLLKPLAKFGKSLVSLLTTIAGGIAGLFGIVCTAITSILCGLLYGLLGLALLVILFVMLLSVLDALAQFFGQFLASNQIKVADDPSYILNMGSNYRNVELSIVEFFSKESGYSNSDLYNDKIEVNDDPLYYAVFNNSFNFFGFSEEVLRTMFPSLPWGAATDCKDVNYRTGTGDRLKNTAAEAAYNTYIAGLDSPSTTMTLKELLEAMVQSAWKVLKAGLSAIGIGESETTFGNINLDPKQFYAFVSTYDVVNATYYIGDKEANPIKSDYEVSNAKDVMSMMDAIYTMSGDPDSDDAMTRTKVLRYMGVGEYQLSAVKIENAATKVAKQQDLDNLFWKTHEIEYKFGTEASQIAFHPSNSSTGKVDTIDETTITTNPNDSRSMLHEVLSTPCTNYATIKGTSKKRPHEDGAPDCYDSYPHTRHRNAIVNDNEHFYGCWGTQGQNMQRHTRYSQVTWTVTSVTTRWNSTKGINESKVFLRCDGNHNGPGATTNAATYCYIELIGFFGLDYAGNPIWPWRGQTVTGQADYNDHKITYYSFGYKKYYEACPHPKIDVPFYFDYCLGHIPLQTNIYVSVANPPDESVTTNLFSHVTNSPSLTVNPGLKPVTVDIGNGLWVWSRDLDVYGFDDLPADTINPQEEWSDSSLVSLTKAKCEEPLEYYYDANGHVTQLKTKHGPNKNNQYLVTAFERNGTIAAEDDGDVLFCVMYYLDNTYYQADFVSQEQKDMKVYNKSWREKTLSFKKSASGMTYPSFKDCY